MKIEIEQILEMLDYRIQESKELQANFNDHIYYIYQDEINAFEQVIGWLEIQSRTIGGTYEG